VPHLPHDVRTRRFWRYFATHLFAAIGFMSAALGLLALLAPAAIPHHEGWFAAGVLVVSLIYGGYRAWPSPITIQYNQPNVTVSVVEGDLFDQPGHLMIGMSDTFDTAIPNIIARASVQGQFLERVFNGDVVALDQRLDDALRTTVPLEDVSKLGKTKRFALGTVAVIREHARCYFCVAYTSMNEANEARGTPAGLWRSLDQLWRAVSLHANGGRLSLPVIGGGLARVAQILPAQDSIRFMVLSFLLASRAEKVCDELVIVVRPSEFRRLDRLELQAYLRSLRPS
jgi:Thoeris protein ThsA, Macro domain